MKRISEIVKGVSESVKASYKEKRITKAIDSAKLNAQEALDIAKVELEEFPDKAKDMSAEDIIQALSGIFDKIEDAEYTIKRLDKIAEYLDEEVPAED